MKVIISESQLDKIIYDFLEEEYYPEYYPKSLIILSFDRYRS